MKTILIPTDFSDTSKHAAAYGYNLAKQIRANIILCNAIVVPAEVPQAGMVAWLPEESEILHNASVDQLNSLKNELLNNDSSESFKPAVSYFDQEGILTDIVDHFVNDHPVELTIIGTHGAGRMNEFFYGDHSKKLIEDAKGPLLIVPASAQILPVNKIAFATDFKNPADDFAAIYQLLPTARLLDAELLIVHIYNEDDHSPNFESSVNGFMRELSNKANYPKIYYRAVQNNRPKAGLDWLAYHGQIDMLAMVHREHGFFEQIFNGSYTEKMAVSTSIPLLVFQAPRN